MFLIDEIVDQFEQSFDEQSNQRTVKTVKKLFVAFLELSQKYRLDEINVSLLTGTAGVSRKSFYLHFENLDAFYRLIINLLVLKYDQYLQGITAPYVFRKYYMAIFRYFFELGPAFHKIFLDESYTRLIISVIENCSAEMSDYFHFFDGYVGNQLLDAAGVFINGGSIMTVRALKLRDPNASLEEIMEIVATLSARTLGITSDLDKLFDPQYINQRANRTLHLI